MKNGKLCVSFAAGFVKSTGLHRILPLFQKNSQIHLLALIKKMSIHVYFNYFNYSIPCILLVVLTFI